MNGLALCPGIGGLELALRVRLGTRYTCVAYVEREAYASAALVARMQDTALDEAPIWDDLCTFDARPWRSRVDFISVGLPCQPYSLAGLQEGHDDERALWPEFVRIVRECEPAVLFLENVPEFLKHFEPVRDELLAMGFTVPPAAIFTAKEHGAPHLRRRVFILAAHSDRVEFGLGEQREPGGSTIGICDGCAQGPVEFVVTHGSSDSDADGGRLEGIGESQHAGQQSARRGQLDGLCSTWGFVDGRLSGVDGRGLWESQSPLLSVVNGSAYRVEQLRAIGNAVIPIVGAVALDYLAAKIGLDLDAL